MAIKKTGIADKEKHLKLKLKMLEIQDLTNKITNLEYQQTREENQKFYEEEQKKIQQEKINQQEEYLKENIFLPGEWAIINKMYRLKKNLELEQRQDIEEKEKYKANINYTEKHKEEWKVLKFNIKNELEYLATNKARKDKLRELFNIKF